MHNIKKFGKDSEMGKEKYVANRETCINSPCVSYATEVDEITEKIEFRSDLIFFRSLLNGK